MTRDELISFVEQLDWHVAQIAASSKSPGPDLIFSTKYLGGS